MQKYTLNALSILIYLSYFLGFFFDENSIGSGGYNSDLTWIWNNFEIFKNYSLIEAIKSDQFFGNRTPLLYILNIIFNPYIDNIDHYRASIFFLSLSGPIIFYLCLKDKFKNTDKNILFLISSSLLLSPFYRTTAIWGMEINYGIITSLISIYFLNKINYSTNIIQNKKIFFLIFFSSITIYFDQKLLIIPILSFLTIIIKNSNIKVKILSVFFYLILAIPFIYLIYLWEGIVPKLTQLSNPNTITSIDRISKLHFYNLGYASTMIGFYLFPLIFFKNDIFENMKIFFFEKKNYIFFFVPFLYLYTLNSNYDFKSYVVDNYWIGFGFIHKISIIFFDKLIYQKIFTYVSIVFSWWIICLVIEKRSRDLLILIYFFLISLFLWPLMQEYFDPIIIIISLLLFKTKIYFNYNNSLFFTMYFSFFLIASNIYYLNIL